MREEDPFSITDRATLRTHFQQELRALCELAKAARLTVAKLARGNETRLLKTAREGLTSAERHATAAHDSLAAGGDGEALAAYMLLHEMLGDSVLSSDFVHEFDCELNEIVEGSGPQKRQRPWTDMEKQLSELSALAGSLAELARDFSHSIDAKETGTMKTDKATAVAVEELGITLATMIAGGGAPTARGQGAASFATVTDQMAASLEAGGFPQFDGSIANVEGKRQRLIDALKNNFSFRDQDGYRVYYRTDRRAAARARSSDSDLLQGAARVNADLLEAETNAVEDIIGRLIVTTRFELARGTEDGPARARTAIREELDGLIASARDPMGINAARTPFQFQRLVLGILQYLQEGEILLGAKIQPASSTGIDTIILSLSRFREEELCGPTSVVEDEELRAELANLFELLVSIGRRLTSDPRRYRLGLYAARLEAQLTCALTSVDLLETALEQSGTDMDEQEVQFLSHGPGTRTLLSIGQFIRWVDGVAQPFAESGNRAATLRQSEAVLLSQELAALAKAAECFKHAARSMGVARLMVHQQLVELTGYLTAASENAAALAGNPHDLSSTTA